MPVPISQNRTVLVQYERCTPLLRSTPIRCERPHDDTGEELSTCRYKLALALGFLLTFLLDPIVTVNSGHQKPYHRSNRAVLMESLRGISMAPIILIMGFDFILSARTHADRVLLC